MDEHDISADGLTKEESERLLEDFRRSRSREVYDYFYQFVQRRLFRAVDKHKNDGKCFLTFQQLDKAIKTANPLQIAAMGILAGYEFAKR
jgi:hypothetical protein